MHHPETKHHPSLRRRLGVGGILLSLLVILGALAYGIYARILFTGPDGKSLIRWDVLPSLSTCKTPAHKTGDSTNTIMSGGLKRSFLVHLPASYGEQPEPLVLMYHGYTGTSFVMMRSSGMDQEADTANFILVLPQGIDDPPSWNAGDGAYGPTGNADDVQFTRDLLTSLEKNYCIDTQRVYATGFSLGGGMVYRLACSSLSAQITAIATVSGAYYPIPGGCHPSRPLSVLEIHGAADPAARYTGNPDLRMASVQDFLNGWLARDTCNSASHVFLQQGTVTATEWTQCAPGTKVVHYRIEDGVHTWPRPFNASAAIWSFFSTFSLPGQENTSKLDGLYSALDKDNKI